MKHIKHLLAALIVLSIGVSALASPNVTGKWKGKLHISLPALPPNLTAEQKQAVAAQMAKVKAATIILNLKGDKTYTASAQGMPGTDQTDTGTWTISGNTLTMTSTKKKKKPGMDKPQKLTISSDGKTITLPIPGGANNKAVFNRA